MIPLDEIKQSQEAQQLELLKKSALQTILTKDARERLNMLKSAHPELASQIEIALIQAAQSGQIAEQITEEKLKIILQQAGSKKGFKIVGR